MAKFERSRERKRDSRASYPKRDAKGGRGFKDSPMGRRDSGRESNNYNRTERNFEMTKVTCSSCGSKCEVPFKPTSTKPVYCKDCFAKKDKVSHNKPSNADLDIINEKLNKIMKALHVK